MFNFIIGGQEALLVLLSAFIIGGIFKTRGLFVPIFTMITDKVRSKRLGLLGISFISGILPVEGRVSISAPILDSLVHTAKDSCCGEHTRGKMGVLDYVATHHYYLWSPLEKSIIILMAGLSLTYNQLLAYTLWPLLAYLSYLVFVIFSYVKEEDIELAKVRKPWTTMEVVRVLPFFFGLGLSIVFPPFYVFPLVALFYIVTNRVNVKEAFSFIKWDTVLLVAGVIVLANVLKANADTIIAYFKSVDSDVTAISTIVPALVGGFAASFTLGSSSKYAGICVALTLVFGMKYFPIILMAEYAGYLLSPTHKCAAISASYFKTRFSDFYRYIGGLAVLMLVVGLLQLL